MTDKYQDNDGVDNNAVNEARAMIYRLLSSLFAKEIDESSWLTLTSKEASGFWEYLACEPNFKQDIRQIQQRLASLTTTEARLELAADYCGLFLVAGKESASPYVSHYLDQSNNKEDTVFGPLHQEIIQFLNHYDLQVKSDFPEPADHIAVVLAYVAHICSHKEVEQLVFIKAYLIDCIAPLSVKVTANDPGDFYSALTNFTHNWIKSDLDWLVSLQD